jgi:hypothetical protein
MDVPTSEVGYTPTMPRREDHEVHKRICGGIGGRKKNLMDLQFAAGIRDFSKASRPTV